MTKYLLAVVFLGVAAPAWAQAPMQPAPAFVPFTVTQDDATQLQNYLNDNVPPRYGTPILNWMQSLELRQQKASAPPAPPSKKPPEKK